VPIANSSHTSVRSQSSLAQTVADLDGSSVAGGSGPAGPRRWAANDAAWLAVTHWGRALSIGYCVYAFVYPNVVPMPYNLVAALTLAMPH
jgi:hypothetical protein